MNDRASESLALHYNPIQFLQEHRTDCLTQHSTARGEEAGSSGNHRQKLKGKQVWSIEQLLSLGNQEPPQYHCTGLPKTTLDEHKCCSENSKLTTGLE